MHLKGDKHVTQRMKSLAKSKTLTDKVRNPVPYTFDVQRPKNMIKLGTYDGKGTSKINHWTKEEKGCIWRYVSVARSRECLGNYLMTKDKILTNSLDR